jgi:hypothetical protein
MVVIEADHGASVVDADSILWTEDRQAFGPYALILHELVFCSKERGALEERDTHTRTERESVCVCVCECV